MRSVEALSSCFMHSCSHTCNESHTVGSEFKGSISTTCLHWWVASYALTTIVIHIIWLSGTKSFYSHGVWHVCINSCSHNHAHTVILWTQYLLDLLSDAHLYLDDQRSKNLKPNKQLLILDHAHLEMHVDCKLVFQNMNIFIPLQCLSNVHDTTMPCTYRCYIHFCI